MSLRELKSKTIVVLTSHLAIFRNGNDGITLCRMDRDFYKNYFVKNPSAMHELFQVIHKHYGFN